LMTLLHYLSKYLLFHILAFYYSLAQRKLTREFSMHSRIVSRLSY
ncbi:hypothetical protein D050_2746B, partial [Vibrio parahaemolyticus VPCR-2009]